MVGHLGNIVVIAKNVGKSIWATKEHQSVQIVLMGQKKKSKRSAAISKV